MNCCMACATCISCIRGISVSLDYPWASPVLCLQASFVILGFMRHLPNARLVQLSSAVRISPRQSSSHPPTRFASTCTQCTPSSSILNLSKLREIKSSKITHQISCPHSPSSEHFQSQSVLSLCWALTARPATYSIWADEAAASFPPCPRRTFSLPRQWA